MRLIRILMALGLVSTAATIGAGCEDNPTTVSQEDLAPPLGLTSVTGNGSVTLHWQASNFGEGGQGFDIYQAAGTQASAPGETIPSAFGTTAVATVTTSQGSGAFSTTITGLTNGTTYSFLVVATKSDGDKLSRPSNVVSDTPRRESAALALSNGTRNSRLVNVGTDPPPASATRLPVGAQGQ